LLLFQALLEGRLMEEHWRLLGYRKRFLAPGGQWSKVGKDQKGFNFAGQELDGQEKQLQSGIYAKDGHYPHFVCVCCQNNWSLVQFVLYVLVLKRSHSSAVNLITRSLTGWKQPIHARPIPLLYCIKSIPRVLDSFLIDNFT
jgi:hypothetical protein